MSKFPHLLIWRFHTKYMALKMVALGWDVAWQWDNVGEITYPTNNPATGKYSMKMEATSDQRCRAYNKVSGSYFNLDSSKSYTIEFKIWIDSNYTDTNIFPEVILSDQWVGKGFGLL